MSDRKTNRGLVGPIAGVLAGFVVVAIVLGISVRGVPLSQSGQGSQELPLLSREETSAHVKQADGDADTLLVLDGENAVSVAATELLSQVMVEMRVPYDTCDLSSEDIGDLADYRRVVLLVPTPRSRMGDDLDDVRSYVEDGGMAMLATMPFDLSELGALEGPLGIDGKSTGAEAVVADIVPREGFMLGGGETYEVDDPTQAALELTLTDEADVLASTSDGSVPLVWTTQLGEGRLVACNLRYYDRAYRGLYSSAFSLLDEACVWPVIDASVWWLDDFPSPVPDGDDAYIERDYHISAAEFYSQVWWPDVLGMSREHGFSYSGALIETYDQQTQGDLGGSVATDTYLYYGNQLVNSGGELAYHGYNHQPLCGPDYTYQQDLGYSTWESADEMSASLDELESFVEGLYDGVEPIAYVPPGNILSDEGRSVVVERHPDIRAIASTYFPGADAYAQEFTVSEDGEVEMPRIVSGERIVGSARIAALSELNLHYVNSHYMNPTDPLGEDGDAALGWEQLKQELGEYMDWLDRAAPDLEPVTASGMAARVQRFANVSPSIAYDGRDIHISLTGFHDRAWLMLRLNGTGSVVSSDGAEVTELTGGLYLVEATSDEVTISREAA